MKNITSYSSGRSLCSFPYHQRPLSPIVKRTFRQFRCPPQCANKNGEDKAGELVVQCSSVCSKASWCFADTVSRPPSAIYAMYVHIDSPESMFQKELNRRGINSSSLDTEGMSSGMQLDCQHLVTDANVSFLNVDRQEQPSSSRGPSPAPQFANRGNEGGQLERSRKLNSEGLEVRHQLRACTYAIKQVVFAKHMPHTVHACRVSYLESHSLHNLEAPFSLPSSQQSFSSPWFFLPYIL